MIRTIAGRLDAVEDGAAALTPATDGSSAPMWCTLTVHLPRYAADELVGRVGRHVELHTIFQLEQQGQGTSFAPRLIGFPAPEDRRFFELITSVKGLGTRKALRAMALPPAEIAIAIAERDLKALQKLPEIGKRLAETIVVELHGKIDAFIIPGASTAPRRRGSIIEPAPRRRGDEAERAIEVLLTLGQTRDAAERAVDRALLDAGEAADSLLADSIVAAAFGAQH